MRAAARSTRCPTSNAGTATARREGVRAGNETGSHSLIASSADGLGGAGDRGASSGRDTAAAARAARWSSSSAGETCAVTALEIDRRLDVGRPRQRLPDPRAARAAPPRPAGRDRRRRRRLRAGRPRAPPPSPRLRGVRPAGPVRQRRRSSEAIEAISRRSDFAVAAHDVVLRGTCPRCERRRRALRPPMPAVAIPLAGLTVIATLLGGLIALRLSPHPADGDRADRGHRRRGGAVRRAARGNRKRRRPGQGDRPGRGRLPRLLLRRAGAGPAPPRRPRRGPRPRAGRGPRRARALRSTAFIDGLGIGLAFGLDASTGFLVFVAVVSHDFADGLNTVSFVLSQSGDRQQATTVAANRRAGAAAGRDRRLAADASPTRRSATCSASTAASSSTWARPTCLPEAHAHASWQKVGLTASGFAADLRDHPGCRGLSTCAAPPALPLRQCQRDRNGHRRRQGVEGEEEQVEPEAEDGGRAPAAVSWRLRSIGEQAARGRGDEDVAEAHRGGAEVDHLQARQLGARVRRR